MQRVGRLIGVAAVALGVVDDQSVLDLVNVEPLADGGIPVGHGLV